MWNKKYKAILFDLDNTLCDDKENRKYAFQKVLKYQREEVSDLKLNKFIEIDEKFWKERVAGKIKDPYEFKSKEEKATWCRAQRFLIYYNNEISFEKAVELNEMYMEYLKEKVVPINGAYEIIKYIYDNKYDIFIVTNGVKRVVPFKLEKLGINNYIKDVITAEEVGTDADIELQEFIVATYSKTFDVRNNKEQDWVYLVYKGNLKSGELKIAEPNKCLGYEKYKIGEVDEKELSNGAKELYDIVSEKYSYLK